MSGGVFLAALPKMKTFFSQDDKEHIPTRSHALVFAASEPQSLVANHLGADTSRYTGHQKRQGKQRQEKDNNERC